MKQLLALALLLALPSVPTAQEPGAQPRPALLDSLGSPVGPSAGFGARLSVSGAPLVGLPFGIGVEGGPAQGVGSLLVGTRFVPSGRLLLAGPPVWRFPFRLDARGRGETGFSTPFVPPALVGRTFVAQAIVFDPSSRAATSLTQGVQVRFGRRGRGPILPARVMANRKTLDAVLADLNGDGLQDVVCGYLRGVGVRLAVGNGSFRESWFYSGTTAFDTVALGDLDGDGVLDLVASKDRPSSFFFGVVSAFHGNGDGTFEPWSSATVSRAGGMALADLDQDGFLDLVLSQEFPNQNQVETLLGQGDGTFVSVGTVPFPSGAASIFPGTVLTGDVNTDGIPDVLVGEGGVGSKVSRFFGNGDGTLRPDGTIDMGSAPGTIGFTDLNQDGVSDLVAASAGSDRITVRLGRKGGGFQGLQGILMKGTPVDLGFGDVNADGFEDIVATMSGSKARVLLGDGSGALSLGQALATGSGPNSPQLGQWTGDDRVDLLIFGRDSPAMALYRGNPTGKFSAPIARGLGDPKDLAVADLDGDADSDVIVLDRSSNEVVVWLGKGSGGFTKVANRTTIQKPRAVSVGDFDGDGAPDLAVIRENAPELRILLGNGDGTFRKGQTTATSGTGVEVADLDGDGALDLVVARSNDVLVLTGRGDGRFDVGGAFSMGAGVWMALLHDFDGDGVVDLATPNSADGETSVRLGLGDGTFGAEVRYAGSKFPLGLAAADLDADGAADLVTLSSVNLLDIRLGRGDGTFGARRMIRTGSFGMDVAIVDLDRDGVPDLVTANTGGNDVSWLRGLGDGSFEEPAEFVAGPNAEHLAIADLNGDLLPDVAVQLAHQDGFVVLFNQLLSETRSDP